MAWLGWARHSARAWLRYLGHGSALIGAILIAAVWLSVAYFLNNEHNTAEQAAVRNATNLAGAFEEHLSRSIAEIDRAIKIVRAHYTGDPDGFDLKSWLQANELFNNDVLQVSIVDPNGLMRQNSVDNARFAGLAVGDREHFRVHVNSTTDDLFISKPVIGRTTGKWSIQLTRRIDKADGSFGGVVIASLDPAYLTRIYNAVNTGAHGHIRVIGLDGTVRATSGPSVGMLGKDMAGIDLFKRYPAQTSGWYYTESNRSDHIRRLIVFRAVASYPLIVTIGQATRDIFAPLAVKQRVGYLVASILTLLIVAITIWNIRESIARTQDKKHLEHTNMLLNATLANMPHGVCMYGPDKKLVIANDLYSTMYGLDPSKVKPGTSLLEILKARIEAGSSPVDTDKYIVDRLEEAFLSTPGYIVNELRDGRIFAISRRTMPDGGAVAIHQDITTQKKAEEWIWHLAHYDGLTNLANRTLFVEQVDSAAARIPTQGGRFAVHLLDLDRFKEVNDSLGHAVGDTLLFEVASRLRAGVGPDDVVARLGGDEFVVLQPCAGADEAAALAQQLLKVISGPFKIDAHHLTVETSIGVVLAPEHGLRAVDLMKKADLALYSAKSDGRNGWRLFKPEMEHEANSRLTLAMDLRTSIAQDELELHYQPVVTAADANVVGAEALVRWRSRERGMVLPGSFIALAEDTGLIIPLGEWVLTRACQDAARWPSDINVAVNLSPVQIRGGNLVDFIKRTLSDAGLPARRLELEVTESVLLQHDEQSLRVLHELKDLGVAIVLDDFGTGYSSMSYLLKFPFDKIKIDRTFVAELPRRNDCAAIVSAACSLARNLDIAITAEGVETAEQLTLLRAAGCTLAQGYLFGRPCPNAELKLDRPQPRAAAS